VKRVAYAVYAAAIIAIVYIAVSGPPYVVVSSYSMVPSLFPGDLVIIEKNPSSVSVGDVVVYRVPEGAKPPFKPGTLVIHRVINVVNGEVFTKGDGNTVPDQPTYVPKLTMDDIYGRAVLVIPYVGWVSLAAQGAFHVLIIALLVAIALYALARVLD